MSTAALRAYSGFLSHSRSDLPRIHSLQPWQSRWMSAQPSQNENIDGTNPDVRRKKVTIQTLQLLHKAQIPITMLTAYDYPSAVACSSSPLTDIILVGDSLAQVCLGYSSTTQLTLPEMIHHTKAVARGTRHPFLVADMPFGSYHSSMSEALSNAVKLKQEGRVEGVKLEGGREIVPVVRRLTNLGIPVMGHVGLLPQRHTAMSGYKVQGLTGDSARKILSDAMALQKAGVFAVVLEAIPQELGKYITEKLRVPTIGIGAGPFTSGQVLVYDDIMGTWPGRKARFVRHFTNLKEVRDTAVHKYCDAVRSRSFPHPEDESYSINKAIWDRFLSSQAQPEPEPDHEHTTEETDELPDEVEKE